MSVVVQRSILRLDALFTFKKGKIKIYLCCIVIVILYCPLKEVFLYRNFQLGPSKSVRCKEVSAKKCPLHRSFLKRILYETNPFLKKCPWKEVSATEDVHYKEVSLSSLLL